jgi:hypothetical protein
MARVGLPAVAIMFGLTTGSVLAADDTVSYEEYKKKQAEKQLPPHERPLLEQYSYSPVLIHTVGTGR